MEKTNSAGGGSKLRGVPARRLTAFQMEDEIERCRAPWKCPQGCYAACVGCLQKNGVDEAREMRADLIRKYGGG